MDIETLATQTGLSAEIIQRTVNYIGPGTTAAKIRRATRTGHVHRPELNELCKATNTVNRYKTLEAQARAERDKLILKALHAGAPISQIAQTTGLTRNRIYAIRDNA